VDIQPALAGDADAIRALLVKEQLPTEDLAGSPLAHFLVLREDHRVIGAVGLDLAGDVGLLRSLVVSTDARRRGLGKHLVAAAERVAWRRGVKSLYLLTTTAQNFFARLGYVAAARDAAPPAIRAMPQFASLCPSTSAFMTRELAHSG
jgi:amino-acid N-acetyltransferase